MNISRPGCFALATLSLTLTTAPALSQEGTGIRGNLSVDQRFDYSDNPNLLAFPGDPKITSTTQLRLDLTSETRTERFNFNIGTDGIGAFGDGATASDDFEFRNERAGVSYGREGANSQLSLGADYSNVAIQDEVFGFFVDGIFDPDALVIDGGQRTTHSARFSFEGGIEGPFGYELSASYRDTDYRGVSNPDLFDNTRNSLDLTTRFRINPAYTARVLAGLSTTDNDDVNQTERQNSYIGLGIEGETAGGVSFRGDLTLDQSETTEGGTTTSEDDGVGFDISATQERPDGSLGLAFSSRIDGSGRRTSASVSRFIDLRNGSLRLSLGVSDQEGSSTEITTTVSYTREFRDGQFSANVTQQPSTEDGTAFLNTSIQLNYLKEIDAISSWDAAVSYGAANEFGTSTGDTRTSASIAYRRDLTEDWRLRAGVSTTRVESSGIDRSRNQVFLSVGRDFTFGF